ncbi:hypothetical protein LXL04_037437 [Taraxacum kok-saghyz]
MYALWTRTDTDVNETKTPAHLDAAPTKLGRRSAAPRKVVRIGHETWRGKSGSMSCGLIGALRACTRGLWVQVRRKTMIRVIETWYLQVNVDGGEGDAITGGLQMQYSAELFLGGLTLGGQYRRSWSTTVKIGQNPPRHLNRLAEGDETENKQGLRLGPD